MTQWTMSSGTASPAITTQAIAKYYDRFTCRLLRDYVYGNPRVTAAIDCALSVVEPRMRRVLDIGCGLGVSSAAIKRRYPWVQVDGVDMSARNIEVARALFKNDEVTFYVSDMQRPPTGYTYDLAMLLDVYEHIPAVERERFHRVLQQCLNENAKVVLTLPSALHQVHLAENHLTGLQVVDETVLPEHIIVLAREIGATLALYKTVSIWNTNDYVHVVLARNPEYIPLYGPSETTPRLWKRLRSKLGRLLDYRGKSMIENRRNQVRECLGIDI